VPFWPGLEKFGSRIRDIHPGSATLVPGLDESAFFRFNILYGNFSRPDFAGVQSGRGLGYSLADVERYSSCHG
jgi:hypothetical protein